MACPSRLPRRTADIGRGHLPLHPEPGVRATPSSAEPHSLRLASRGHPGSGCVPPAGVSFCQRSHRGSRTSWRSNADAVIESAPVIVRDTSALRHRRPSPRFLLRVVSLCDILPAPRSSTPPRDSQQGDEKDEGGTLGAPSTRSASTVGRPEHRPNHVKTAFRSNHSGRRSCCPA